jgi:hypothetical protein
MAREQRQTPDIEEDPVLKALQEEYDRIKRDTEYARLRGEIARMQRQKNIEEMWHLPDPLPHPINGTRRCFVGCKLPGGVKLQLFQRVAKEIPSYAGVVTDMVAQPVSELLIEGYGFDPRTRKSKHLAISIEHCFYLINDVNADWIDIWRRQNTDNDLVNSKALIFADTAQGFLGLSKELHDVWIGMEPMDLPERKQYERDEDFYKRIRDPRALSILHGNKQLTEIGKFEGKIG